MHRAKLTLQHIFPPTQYAQELRETANAIVAPGKGILAADESTSTIGSRFQKINLENTEPNRRDYRELLFTTKGLSNYISGVILFDETINQKASDGTPFVDLMRSNGLIIGIKVDKGVAVIPGTDEETLTQGIEGLGARCADYYKKGARFSKWRSVLKISSQGEAPSDLAVAENARGLALYAAICQQHGLVPIIEPEILSDGDHSIEVCEAVAQRVWEETVKALHDQRVYFEGILLKPSMVTPGAQYKGPKATSEQIAAATVRVLQRTIPPAVPGVSFLSGGQSEQEATQNLNAMNQYASKTRVPWSLTFSYGRALQASTIKTWEGKKENVAKAQEVLLFRAKANSLAQFGKYEGESTVGESLYVKDYKY